MRLGIDVGSTTVKLVLLDENDEEIMSMLGGKKAIILYNKTDLTPVIPLEELR